MKKLLFIFALSFLSVTAFGQSADNVQEPQDSVWSDILKSYGNRIRFVESTIGELTYWSLIKEVKAPTISISVISFYSEENKYLQSYVRFGRILMFLETVPLVLKAMDSLFYSETDDCANTEDYIKTYYTTDNNVQIGYHVSHGHSLWTLSQGNHRFETRNPNDIYQMFTKALEKAKEHAK